MNITLDIKISIFHTMQIPILLSILKKIQPVQQILADYTDIANFHLSNKIQLSEFIMKLSLLKYIHILVY